MCATSPCGADDQARGGPSDVLGAGWVLLFLPRGVLFLGDLASLTTSVALFRTWWNSGSNQGESHTSIYALARRVADMVVTYAVTSSRPAPNLDQRAPHAQAARGSPAFASARFCSESAGVTRGRRGRRRNAGVVPALPIERRCIADG
jgi:hypothetical protein